MRRPSGRRGIRSSCSSCDHFLFLGCCPCWGPALHHLDAPSLCPAKPDPALTLPHLTRPRTRTLEPPPPGRLIHPGGGGELDQSSSARTVTSASNRPNCARKSPRPSNLPAASAKDLNSSRVM